MKKYIPALLILLILLPITAYAHSGRTDSNGGHYNHSTGKYHWHHGEDAHQHYDMDGDGDLDCPRHYRYQDNAYPEDVTLPTWVPIQLPTFPEIEIPTSLNPAQQKQIANNHTSEIMDSDDLKFYSVGGLIVFVLGIAMCFILHKK